MLSGPLHAQSARARPEARAALGGGRVDGVQR